MGMKLGSSVLLVAAGAVASAGCVEEMDPESLIADTRVLGARVEVVGDPARAWPKPGETATVFLLVVNPRLDHDFSRMQSMALTCTPAPFGSGFPVCLEMVEASDRADAGADGAGVFGGVFEQPGRLTCDDLEALQNLLSGQSALVPVTLACAQGEPQFTISTPADAKYDARLILGVTCDQGEAFLDPSQPEIFGCDLGADGRKELWDLKIPLQVDKAVNHHPKLTKLFLDKRTWPEVAPEELVKRARHGKPTEGQIDCVQAVADGLLPEIAANRSKVTIAFEGQGFETYEKRGKSEREQLWVANYATSGKLSRAQSVLKADQPRAEVTFKPPGDVSESGALVRFFFTIRDRRGGFDSTTRALCVTRNSKESDGG